MWITAVLLVSGAASVIFGIVLRASPGLARDAGLRQVRWAWNSWQFFVLAGAVCFLFGMGHFAEARSPWRWSLWGLGFAGMVLSAVLDTVRKKRHASRPPLA